MAAAAAEADSEPDLEQKEGRMTINRAVLAALAAALVCAGAAAAAGRPGATTLSYSVHFSPSFVVDLGTKGPSKGDEIVANDVIVTHAGKPVGRDGIICTIVDPKGPEAACFATFVVPGGTISGQFLNSPPPRKLIAVTGGTGRFAGARGQGVLFESGRELSNDNTLTFTLTA